MQLHIKEHRDVISCLEKAGLVTDVQLIKRKGWVFIKLKDKSFAFHRKKVTSLVNGQFVNRYEYYVNYPSAPVKVDSWEQVVERLANWLANWLA